MNVFRCGKFVVVLLFLSVLISALFGCSRPRDPTIGVPINATLKSSREATVLISSSAGRGTGFFISPDAIITCFHVIATISVTSNQFRWSIAQDIKVTKNDGEICDALVVSIPCQQNLNPLKFDFAVLRLKSKPRGNVYSLRLASPSTAVEIGADVILSGYPLATPAMVSHKGMVSGVSTNGEIICIQTSINKGNSGGALCTANGEVIGIVSMREGGISVGLDHLATYIEATSKQGKITLMGVDPLQAIREVTLTLDQYISTGIGYARSIRHVRNYLAAHPDLLR